MNEITSRDNQHLKFARSVRDGLETASIFIEGTRLVEEGIRSNLFISKYFVASSFAKSYRGGEFLRLAERMEISIFLVADAVFKTIADTENPQGIIAIGTRPVASSEMVEKGLKENPLKLAVLLYQVNNPANLGAVIRTAEAAGVAGIVTTTGSADVFSPKSLRSSMGSAFRLPVWESANADEVIEWAKEAGLKATALDINGRSTIYEADWREPRLLIIGSEAHGLTDKMLSSSEDILTIPMATPVESLNLAVSCGITVFEARRQNGK